MDKVYERKLMELFMDLFENRNNQYIVVTPKVCNIHLIINNTVSKNKLKQLLTLLKNYFILEIF